MDNNNNNRRYAGLQAQEKKLAASRIFNLVAILALVVMAIWIFRPNQKTASVPVDVEGAIGATQTAMASAADIDSAIRATQTAVAMDVAKGASTPSTTPDVAPNVSTITSVVSADCRSFEVCGGFTGTLHDPSIQWKASNDDVCTLGIPSGTTLAGLSGVDFDACTGFNQHPKDKGTDARRTVVTWTYSDQDLAQQLYDWTGKGEKYAGLAWWGPNFGIGAAYALVSYNGSTPKICRSFQIKAGVTIDVTFVNESDQVSAVWGQARVENWHMPECLAP